MNDKTTDASTVPILVTGGTGNLGRRVVRRLREAGRVVRVLSRHPAENSAGITYLTGDTVRGTSLDVAMRGVGVVLHLAGGAKGDDTAAGHVARAARAAGVDHLVLISVIGAGKMPIGYFRAKAAAEQAIVDSGVPFSILRAAQFHDFVRGTIGAMAKFPLVPAPGGLRFEPVAAEEVAEALVTLALGEPAGFAPDLAGPEVLRVDEILSPLFERRGRRRPLWRLRMPGAVGRSYRAGDNLAETGARRGSETWKEYLAESMNT